MEEACSKTPLKNSPGVAAFIDESVQYFVRCEQKVLCQAPSPKVAGK